MAALGRKASEAAAAAAALANPFTRRVAEAIAIATSKDATKSASLRRKSSNDDNANRDDDGRRRCTDPASSFAFFDTMCGPMLRNPFLGVNESNDAEDLGGSNRSSGRGGTSDRGRRGRSSLGGGRRPTSSYDYDDDTMATGSYEDDDETYDDDSRRNKRSRGRDRKPRPPADSPSEMTGAFSEFDDDTTQNDTVTDTSTWESKSTRDKSKKKEDDSATKDSEKLITQPLASGFAKRCYFTKSGIGRSTQHYEGLTLTGNTVLMLAAAMKLKGCPTICDEDLRRVEQTYPNQFSRLPDELLLSSGWRRISKYCHFSHKPLPDGVPFFHSRKRCHPNNGGFYFLLCSAVGMTRLMDVEPLNRDALAVLQTDYPMTCEKAPDFLCADPGEWTLVNKFCFFSGGPINVEEDVYYRAELGGTEIFMLAFLSPSLSPEELYRLKASSTAEGQQQEDTGPLKSIAAVEEVESVYDLTERDFDDLKLYHLGPCRALPPHLLHPETWTKVLPPHFMAAREEALRIAEEWESRFPPQLSASQSVSGNSHQIPVGQGAEVGMNNSGMAGESPGSGYVELGGAGGRGMPSPAGPGYPPQYPMHHHPQQQMSQDPNAPYYPPPPGPGGEFGMDQQVAGGYPPHHQHPQYGASPTPVMESEMNYYYDASPEGGMPPPGAGAIGASPNPVHFHQQQQHNMPPPSYGNPNNVVGDPSPDRMSASMMDPRGGGGPLPLYDAVGHHHQPYNNDQHLPPQHMMGDPHWRDIQEEGAFGSVAGDQPDDEAQGGMYGGGMSGGGPPGGGGMMPIPMMELEDQYAEDQYADQYGNRQDPPDSDIVSKSQYPYGDDAKSVASGHSSLMGGAQNRLKQNRMKKMKERSHQRPDLSSKLGNKNITSPGEGADDSTWDTRTDGESSYGTSLVSSASGYTDTTNPNERNSRRALILQMAKARMKNVKEASTVEKNDAQEGQGEDPQDELADEVAGLELD
mmetsp:Transcript_24852/g.53609  ORF Transcript_24852/g.53609 Transcript_24852/m.53609 type:complete len:973 (-) Transcript_24852:249-3167(-)